MLIVLKERICGDKTLKEVADILNIKTAERVRQIENKAFEKLQKQMASLAANLESLNNVYGGVLGAMNNKK